MQDMTPEACAEGDVQGKTLTDKRDNSTYTVARLRDGNCWMTQNLKLINKTISSTDSDMTSGSFTVPASSASTTATSGISGFTNSDISSPSAFLNSYGGYYNYYTATADTAPSGAGTATSSICPKGWQLPVNGNSNTNKSYAKLLNGLSANMLVSFPYYFVYGGSVYDSSLDAAGSDGYYWSSTANSSTYAYYLRFGSGGVYPSYSSSRYYGLSVRCVAR